MASARKHLEKNRMENKAAIVRSQIKLNGLWLNHKPFLLNKPTGEMNITLILPYHREVFRCLPNQYMGL